MSAKAINEVSKVIQTEGMSEELRNSLWNTLDIFLWNKTDFVTAYYGTPGIEPFSRALWFQHFKQPLDRRPRNGSDILSIIREYFFSCIWFDVYDFLEWTLNNQENQRLTETINGILKQEMSGYRFVSKQFTSITDEQEIASLEQTMSDENFPGVKAHLNAALSLLSNRETPDYRNSIKESISAVESMAKAITGDPKATLGKALATLEKDSRLHPALKDSFSKLYGYTSDEDGIRHAMLEEPNLDVADAKFFLLSCTSFINYLKSKI